MLTRRNTVSSPNPATATIRRNSRIRRAKTVSHHATPKMTRSEMLAPEERSQQAIAAAKRAYGDDMQRRRSQIVRFETLVSNEGEEDISRYPTANEAVRTSNDDIATGESPVPELYDTDESGKAKEWKMQESMQQQRFTPRGRRSMNFTVSDADDYPGSFNTSTPSSYRRLRKAKSVFSVGQVFSKDLPHDDYPSSVVYSSERSPDGAESKSRRKSTSFLRGGTDFMPESMRRQYEEEKPVQKERKSFYLSASARRWQKPVAFPETVRGKKKEPEEPSSLSVRKAVGEKARKMSASFFGTMRRAFGKQVKLEPNFPEQHVTSTRQHFRDYVSPSELHDDIMDIPEPNNLTIRPAVVSRAPTFRHVPSYEMLRSVAGSMGEASPPVPPLNRATSIATDGKSTWNATLGASLKKKRLSIIDENIPNKIKEHIYSPPPLEQQQTQKSYEAKRVYSALMRRLDRGSPSVKREEAEYVHGPGYNGPGYYMAPGLALRPEEENMFERPYTAASTNTVVTAIRKNSGKWRRSSKDGNEIPPVPALPMFYQLEQKNEGGNCSNNHNNNNNNNNKDNDNTDEWITGTLALGEMEQMSVDSKLAGLAEQVSGLAVNSDGGSGLVNALPTTPRRRLRMARSASTFFPYSSSVDEVLRESTPSPYRKATGTMDNDSKSSVYAHSTTTTGRAPSQNTPPQMLALAQRPSEYFYRGVNIAPIAPKMKIRGGLKIKNYNPDRSQSSILVANENYTNTPRNTPRNTPSSISMNEKYTSSKSKNKENESRKKTKVMLRTGSQGHGMPPVIYRSRSVLSQMSSVDIENAVNSQFGPVVTSEGTGWKEESRDRVGEKIPMERRMDSPMVFL